MDSWGSGGSPTAPLLRSRSMLPTGTLISHVLTHSGQQGPAPHASRGPTHAPCLQGAHGTTHRGCLPYPVPEDTAFPPDVPELRGEEQGGRVRTGHSPRRLGLGRPQAWARGQCVAVNRQAPVPPSHHTPEGQESRNRTLKLVFPGRNVCRAPPHLPSLGGCECRRRGRSRPTKSRKPVPSERTHSRVPLPA